MDLVLRLLKGNQQPSVNWYLWNYLFRHYSVNSVSEIYFLIQGISMATIWPGCFSLKVLCNFPLLLQNVCTGQPFSIMLYTLCRVHGLFPRRGALHHLQWGPPGTPIPSHPVGGCPGRPGHFAVLQMSTMPQGTVQDQELSPPTTLALRCLCSYYGHA